MINLEKINNRSIKLENGCIKWLGAKSSTGYGHARFNGKHILIHRLVLHLVKNFDLSSNFVVCHSCDNPLCINIEHLIVGTQGYNLEDAYKKKRKRPSNKYTHATYCVNGHKFGEGRRICRICKNNRQNKSRRFKRDNLEKGENYKC